MLHPVGLLLATQVQDVWARVSLNAILVVGNNGRKMGRTLSLT